MDQYLLIPFLGDEHPFTSYFDVHQGYKVLTHCHIAYIRNCVASIQRKMISFKISKTLKKCEPLLIKHDNGTSPCVEGLLIKSG